MSVVVLHTTESDASIDSIGAYLLREGKASNEVYDPTSDRTVQLVPAGVASASLRNLDGGVQTNRRESDGRTGADVYQMEIRGRAVEVGGYRDEWHRNLANHIAQVCYLTGTPLEFPCTFEAYPPRDGIRLDGREPWRLTFAEWLTVEGVIGHQHVPENVHGDPGDISRTIAFIRNLHTQGDEMATAQEIAAAVWAHGLATAKDGEQPAGTVLGWSKDEIDGKGTPGADLFARIKAAVPATAIDYDLLAQKIAERVVVPIGAAPSHDAIKAAVLEVLTEHPLAPKA